MVSALGWTLVHFVWQGALIGIAAAALWRLCESSSTRYAVGVIALAVVAASFGVTWVIMLERGSLPASVTDASASVATVSSWHVAVPLHAGLANISVATNAPLARPLSRANRQGAWLPLCVAVWFCGVVVLSLRFARRWLAAMRVATRGVTAATADVAILAASVCARLSLTRAVRVVESSLVRVPTVVGWLKPVVLLPAALVMGLAPADLEALLAHELAHVRRHDYLVNLLQSLVETLCFYHPAAWWISHRVRVEREFCCDDLAVELCGDRVRYASALARLETLRGAPAMALAASGGSLVTRVRRILSAEPDPRAMSSGWIGAALVMLLVVSAAPLVLGSTTNASPRALSPIVTMAPAARVAFERAPAVQTTPAPRAVVESVPPPVPNLDVHSAPAEVASAVDPRQTQMLPSTAVPVQISGATDGPLTAASFAGRDVWVLLFDTTGMSATDVQRAKDSAVKWIDERMSDADLVLVSAIGSKLSVLQDFTTNKDRVRASLSGLPDTSSITGVNGAVWGPEAKFLKPGANTTADPSAQSLDTFSTDMRLRAIATICDALRPLQSTKTLLYFSGGMQRGGTDNQAELRAATSACSAANVAIDPVDSRGLQPIVPGGFLAGSSRAFGAVDSTSGFPDLQFDSKGVDFGPWVSGFIRQVKQHWLVPRSAEVMSGHVVVRFGVHRDGSVDDVQIVSPSKVDAFNISAVNAIRQSAPVLPLPAAYPVDVCTFTVTFFYNEHPAQTAQSRAPTPRPGFGGPDAHYQLGVGDVVHISILNHRDVGFDGDYEVQPDGAILFKDLKTGKLVVKDLTLRQIETDLHQQLIDDQILDDAQVAVTIAKFRSKTVNVQGAVREPGSLTLGANKMTVLEALNRAGGTLLDAGAQVQVKRKGTDGSETTIAINLHDLKAGLVGDTALQDGDVVDVPTAPRFFVQGYINSPGQQFWVPGLTVGKAIQAAGGFKPEGAHDPHLHWIEQGGKIHDDKILEKDIATYVIPQAIVDTGTMYLEVTKRTVPLTISGEVKNPGVYTWTRGMTVLQAITLAGGFTEDAATIPDVIEIVGPKKR